MARESDRNIECKRSCPVVRSGKLCIEVTPESKIAFISERLCIGCGMFCGLWTAKGNADKHSRYLPEEMSL